MWLACPIYTLIGRAIIHLRQQSLWQQIMFWWDRKLQLTRIFSFLFPAFRTRKKKYVSIKTVTLTLNKHKINQRHYQNLSWILKVVFLCKITSYSIIIIIIASSMNSFSCKRNISSFGKKSWLQLLLQLEHNFFLMLIIIIKAFLFHFIIVIIFIIIKNLIAYDKSERYICITWQVCHIK